ncbi:MAG: holo-[acyl-carrier-protein] synthase [Verrucomicrobiales bacterium]|nr:holo-[acyl-carrier-protein] synthase [Verrucomicrobiales bacterium]
MIKPGTYVFGIGIDIIDTDRIEESVKKFGDRFLDRIFTPAERSYCEARKPSSRHFAARFAAKEAIAKALGTGIGVHLEWRDMEILRDEAGKPYVTLSGNGKDFADENKIREILISLSHADNHAAANALAVAEIGA